MSAPVDEIRAGITQQPTSEILRAIIWISSSTIRGSCKLVARVMLLNDEELFEVHDILCRELDMRIPVR